MKNSTYELFESSILLKVGDLIDAEANDSLLEEISTYIENGRNYIVVDFSNQLYCNSLGISFLIKLLTLSRNHGGDCVLSSLSTNTEKLLITTKLTSLFDIYENSQKALEVHA